MGRLNIDCSDVYGFTGYEFFCKFFACDDSEDILWYLNEYITTLYNLNGSEFHKKRIAVFLEDNESRNCLFIDDIKDGNYVFNIKRGDAIKKLQLLQSLVNDASIELPYKIDIIYYDEFLLEDEGYDLLIIKLFMISQE